MKVPVLTIMFLIMFGLKLAGSIAFSWWLVFLPIYIIPAFLLSSFLVVFLVSCFASK
jgi:hypothetical protein